ncbi:DnaJ -like protein subfamily C member 24 [Channa argus]|uniref:DnaJ-like protein subfamily C member 24 n=1 Tax=Channa argus TaxID=215402 RepID=A0A6G1Q842_CHAAH|nr:DnaJ -like protein subfamily C member 24 [Channa argus]
MCDGAEKDLYAVLGASPSDSVQQLRHRYQQLARKYHPDRLEAQCSVEAESGVKNFLEADAAWRILSDQNKRRQYDMLRRDECLYKYHCRCGGGFSVAEDEVQEETKSRQQDNEKGEAERGWHRGVVVCCDTCSLSLCVKKTLNV